MQKVKEVSADQITLGSAATPYFWIAIAIAVVGLIGSGIAYMGGEGEHPHQAFFQAYLLNFSYMLSVALGSLFFLIIMHLTRAGWSVVIRRIAEVVSITLLPLLLLSGGVILGMHDIYHWTHTEDVANDPILLGKAAMLNENFFIVRVLIYFAIWIGISWFFRSRSVKQDQTGDPKLTRQMEVFAAPALIIYALTVTGASFDFLMSVNPHWYSTMFGVYFFAGCLLGFFSIIPLIIMLLHRAGKLTEIVNVEHFHDMGKLIFAFTVFWAYIAFSQYMLIWYANLPEETGWYEIRQTGFWSTWSVFLLVGHFLVPFLFIMSRYQKRRPIMLAIAAIWMLLMHWVDLYYLLMPGHRSVENPFVLADFTLFLALGGLFFATVMWGLGRVNLIPVKDPRLAESMRFENA